MKEKIKNEGFYDEVGGYHDCGIGWSPKGTWCGECTSASCKYCPNVIKDKRERRKYMKKFKTDILWVMGLIICTASLALLMFIKFTKTPDIIKHVEAYDNNVLIDPELKPETVSSPTVVYTDLGVPSGIDTSFKTYMDWRKITNSSSAQYKYIRKFGWCDGEGFMRASGERALGITDDYYMIALGSYYGTTIGTKYRITTDTGMIFYGVLTDSKADIHTNSTNQYARNHDVVEFLVDIRYLNRTVKRMGSANVYMPLNGHIAKIERIDFID